MANIWFFGDSYCHPCNYDNNYISAWWGEKLADKLGLQTMGEWKNDNTKVETSCGGTGISFLLEKLLMHKDKVKEDDIVVIAYSGINRHRFNNFNFRWRNDEHLEKINGGMLPDRVRRAYDFFELYLNGPEIKRAYLATISFIQHIVIPSLNAKKVVEYYVFPMSTDEEEPMYNYLKKLDTIQNFIYEIGGNLGYDDVIIGKIQECTGHFGTPYDEYDITDYWVEKVLKDINE